MNEEGEKPRVSLLLKKCNVLAYFIVTVEFERERAYVDAHQFTDNESPRRRWQQFWRIVAITSTSVAFFPRARHIPQWSSVGRTGTRMNFTDLLTSRALPADMIELANDGLLHSCSRQKTR